MEGNNGQFTTCHVTLYVLMHSRSFARFSQFVFVLAQLEDVLKHVWCERLVAVVRVILDDEVLVNTLSDSKITSGVINEDHVRRHQRARGQPTSRSTRRG